MTEERLFELAVRMTESDRAALLDRECAGQPELRARIEALLAADAAPKLTIDSPVEGTGPFRESGDEAGAVIAGRYTLVELIGEGGMGQVWVAKQSEPVRRTVALKLIKEGMDTKAVLQRFEAERQALALMDHPNIAKVLDGGMTAERRPFFVMELIHGMPLTRFCDDAKFNIRQRLELFVAICQAVQHAHQKGIVHRDLKPSNILVTVVDGKPVPKVIDFGVAKAVGGRLTDESLFTGFGALVGTLEYMSPEQAGFTGTDVDTRADIYSLGVILYELLTGLRPIDSKRLRQAVLTEMVRLIQEEEPSKPSTRLSADASLPSLAAVRQTNPKRLTAVLRGELDWVVMKCLEKDRNRRYATANGLARDLQHYLADEPVEARPASAGYRLKKYVARNKGLVFTATTVVLALALGLIGTLWQARTARAEAARADERAVAADAAADAEKTRAAELKQVVDFQVQMLKNIDAQTAGAALMQDIRARFAASLVKAQVPETVRLARATSLERELANVNSTDIAATMIDRTILKPSAQTIETQFKEQPAVDATLRHTLAVSYYALGRYDDALPLQRQALALRRRVLGDNAEATLEAMDNLGQLLQLQGKLAEAEPIAREAMDRSRLVNGGDHPNSLKFINNFALIVKSQGKLAEAEPYYREAMDQARRVLGEDHAETLRYISNLGRLLQERGDLVQARTYFLESLTKRRRVLGENHQDTILSVALMGALLEAESRLDEAVPYYLEVAEKRRRILGEDHPSTMEAVSNIGFIRARQGRFADAEPYFRETLEKRRRLLGDSHPDTLYSINNMSQILTYQQKLADAEPFAREALASSRHVRGEDHPDTIRCLSNLGNLLRQRENFTEAERYLGEALEKSRRVLGENHRGTLIAINSMAFLLSMQGKRGEAEILSREALDRGRRVFGPDHVETLVFINNFGRLLNDQKKFAEAETLCREAVAGYERGRGRDHWLTGNARMELARACAGLNRRPEAESALIEAERVLASAEGVPAGRHKQCVEALVELYESWAKAEPTQGYEAKIEKWKTKLETIKPPAPAGGKP